VAKKTPAQLVRDRLALAAQEAAKGNMQAAANYAQAAANIKGSGQATTQAAASQYAAAATAAQQQTQDMPGGRPFAQVAPQGATQGAATETAAERAQREYYQNLENERVANRAEESRSAKAFLRSILEQYNLGSLADSVESIVGETVNQDVIAERLRQTEAYKTRFKGLAALQRRGITDIRNEGEYLNLESNYRQVFREAGLQNFLGDAGTQAEYDSIAKLAGDFSVSVNEVRDRISDAQRVVANTPQEVRDSLQKFYNVDPATLVSYVLDPTRTSSEINRRANAAIVGGFATRAGLEFGAGVSERVGEFFGRGGDISGTALEPELTQIADVQRSTKRLADIEKGLLSAEESALSTLDLDIEAKEKVRGLQSRERARFGGTSALTSASLSRGKVI
jgi:hypothetical protein